MICALARAVRFCVLLSYPFYWIDAAAFDSIRLPVNGLRVVDPSRHPDGLSLDACHFHFGVDSLFKYRSKALCCIS